MNKTYNFIVNVIAVFSTIITIGCSSTKKVWYKPNMNEDNWAIDNASCHSRAHKRAEEGFTERSPVSQNESNNIKSYKMLMERHGAKKNLKKIYLKCLRTKGYKLINPKPKPGQQT